jgi:hypothetical protein
MDSRNGKAGCRGCNMPTNQQLSVAVLEDRDKYSYIRDFTVLLNQESDTADKLLVQGKTRRGQHSSRGSLPQGDSYISRID